MFKFTFSFKDIHMSLTTPQVNPTKAGTKPVAEYLLQCPTTTGHNYVPTKIHI